MCQVAPEREAVEGDAMVVIPLVTQTPIMVGMALDRPPQPAAYPLGMGHGALGMEVVDGVTKGIVQRGRARLVTGTQTPCNASGVRVGPYGQGIPYPSVGFKPAWGNWGNVAHSTLVTATQANSRPNAFPSQPPDKGQPA